MSKLIDKEVTVLNVLKDENGNSIITPEQQLFIDNFKSGGVTEECPACEGEGICGCEYCDVCHGKKTFTYYRVLKIEAISKEAMDQLTFGKLKGKDAKKFLETNTDKIVFNGTVKDWKNIPKEINAISIDSKGKIKYYSGVSGIYDLYDDEHSISNKYKGGQYWYYGTAKEGLDITDKYKDIKLLVKANFQHNIYYRHKIKRTVLDFEKPFDWSIFPKACTQLFISFGSINIKDQSIDIVVGSNDIYLRDDNVIWGHDGRNHVDMKFDINLCREWINDGTEAYPVFKSNMTKIGYNEMNIELRNIPYKTVVYELPKDRSKPVAVNDLKTLKDELCLRINEHTRRINDSMTVAQYPFWYPKGPQHEVEYWLLTNMVTIGAYEITEDLVINAEGDVRIQNNEATELKYKFGFVEGKFTLLGKNYKSLKNLPDECNKLVISHSEKIKDVTVNKTNVKSGIVKIQFLNNLKSIGKMHDSIKKLEYMYIDNFEDIDFDKDCMRLNIKANYKD